jgi:hypothetical protein
MDPISKIFPDPDPTRTLAGPGPGRTRRALLNRGLQNVLVSFVKILFHFGVFFIRKVKSENRLCQIIQKKKSRKEKSRKKNLERKKSRKKKSRKKKI